MDKKGVYESGDSVKNHPKSPILILGIIGRYHVSFVTLLSSFSDGNVTSSIKVSMIFENENIHLSDLDNIKFKKASLSFNNINNFVKSNGIREKPHRDANNRLKKYTLNYEFPKFDEVKLKRFKLKLNPHLSRKKDFDSRIKINEEIKIDLTYSSEENFEKIQKDIIQISRFFNLIMGKSLLIGIESEFSENSRIKIYTPNIVNAMNNKEKISIFNTLFKFEEFNTPNLLKNWFEKYDLLKSFDLYFLTIYSKSFAVSILLSYTQALEAYCRKKQDIKTEYYSKDSLEFDSLKEKLKSSVDESFNKINDFEIVEGFKDKMSNCIKYSYQYS